MESTLTSPSAEPASITVAPRWHTWVRRALLVIFGINMVLTVALTWTHNQITDTDRYMRTVSPLASDPAIQEAIVSAVTTQISDQVADFTSRSRILDGQGVLAAPISKMLSDYVERTVRDLVTSDEFSTLWVEMNRTLQPVVAAVLTGSDLENGTTSGGKIVLNLSPLMDRLSSRLSDNGIDLFNGAVNNRVDVYFTVVDSPELSNVQNLMAKLDRLTWFVPFIALLALIGYLWLSPDRRVGFAWLGLTLALSMALLLLVLSIVRWRYLDRIDSPVQHNAMSAFFDTIGHYLRLGARVLGVAGLIIALIAVILQPGGLLASIRRLFDRLVTAISIKGIQGSAAGELSWIERNRTLLLGSLLGIMCLALLGPERLSQGWGRSVMLLAVLGFGLIWLATRVQVDAVPVPAAVAASLTVPVSDPVPAPLAMQRSAATAGTAVSAVAAMPTEIGSASRPLAELAADLSAEDQALLVQMAIALHKR